jgi:hypothetical protein
MQDEYFSRAEVSNSDLSWLAKYWMPQQQIYDIEQAYRFGTLVDAIITEPFKVNYFKCTVDGVQYTQPEFDKATAMKKAFMSDPLCNRLLQLSSMQHIMSEQKTFSHNETDFQLNVRCKWDLWLPGQNYGGDIKSTTATTQKQFEAACMHFHYDRQRAWYMDIAGSNQDILIGISKVNNQIFKLPIKRGDKFYSSGKEKYLDLAFKWWYLFN